MFRDSETIEKLIPTVRVFLLFDDGMFDVVISFVPNETFFVYSTITRENARDERTRATARKYIANVIPKCIRIVSKISKKKLP